MENENEEKSPFVTSSPDSAGNSLIFRIIVTSFAILLIVFGKSNMPYDAVSCIEDEVLKIFNGLCEAIKNHQTLVTVLQTISNLIVDCAFVGMMVHWYLKVNSLRYPLAMALYGITKAAVMYLNQIRQIPQSLYSYSTLPSIFGADVFKEDYFFNTHCGIVLVTGLELAHLGVNLLSKLCYFGAAYIGVLALILRNDYFMDVFVGFAVAHLIYRLICKYQQSKINPFLEKLLPSQD